MSIKPDTTDLFSSEVATQVPTEKEKAPTETGTKEVETRKNGNGLSVARHFTKTDTDPLETVEYERRSSRITEPNGEVVFELKNLEVPKSWSQLATDILASKYIRRAGVPETGYEISARQVIHRIANTIRDYGEEQNYFSSKEDADTFESELSYILINQHGAFNSPVWFNVGLYHQYGIEGNGGNYFWDPDTNTIKEASDSFSHPQGSACFINAVRDDLMSIFETK
jgi:ribonucleoside-diphosphate reductase alpha chain